MKEVERKVHEITGEARQPKKICGVEKGKEKRFNEKRFTDRRFREPTCVIQKEEYGLRV
jgi:hypothetical protein